jgi:hypothetical protein
MGRFVSSWCDHAVLPLLRRVVALDFLACLDLGDRAYFCTSREAQFGALLEVISVDAPRYVGELLESLAPFQPRHLSEESASFARAC